MYGEGGGLFFTESQNGRGWKGPLGPTPLLTWVFFSTGSPGTNAASLDISQMYSEYKISALCDSLQTTVVQSPFTATNSELSVAAFQYLKGA